MDLEQKMQNVLLKRGWKKLLSNPPRCQECSQVIPLPQDFPEEGADLELRCHGCGERAFLGDLVNERGSAKAAWDLQASDLQPPKETQIKYQQRPDGTEMWLIPKTGKSSIGVFAYIWCAFVGIFTLVAVPSIISSDDFHGWQRLLVLFPVPFIAAGWWLMRTHIREAKSDYLIEVSDSKLQMTRKTKNRTSAPQVIPRAEVESLGLEVFYTSNYQPVYGVEIRSKQTKLRFGASLETAEKRWMAATLRSRLGLQDFGNAEASPEGEAGVAPLSGLTPYKSSNLELVALNDDSFRARIKVSGGIFILIFGIVFAMIGASLLFFVDAAVFVKAIFGLVFCAIGVVTAFFGYRQTSLSRELEFSASGLRIRTKHFENYKTESFPTEQIGGPDMRQSGHVNNQPRYEVSLKLSGRKRKLISFGKREDAAALKTWIEAWMS